MNVQPVIANRLFQQADSEIRALPVKGLDDITRLSETDGILNVSLSYPSTEDLRPQVYGRIKETDWILLAFHQETQSLENIFRELTKEN